MHIVVAAKQVLDPDGVNSYALWGKLAVDASGRSFTVGNLIPHIINAYDEQAMEAALRLKDADPSVRITAVSVGPESTAEVLKRCFALGAESAIQVIDPESAAADGFRTGALIAAAIRELGDVDLVLCGRQGSDYDQGTVPAVVAELTGAAYVTLASAVEAVAGGVRVTRASPLGTEVVEAALPAVVTVSNELGTPRYPTSRGMLEARRKRPEVREAGALMATMQAGWSPILGSVELVEVFVPDVQGHCEIITGESPAEKAEKLWQRIVATGVFDA
jgi:electron transfer flavoprotein beta subunit